MKTIAVQPFATPITASVTVPGSKSYTNRTLLIAAMTPGPVRLINPLVSDDTRTMVDCLRKLGLKITESEGFLVVENNVSEVQDTSYQLNANLSGTTLRFLLPLVCTIPGTKILGGQAGLNKRPIGDLVDTLRQLGADITYLDKEGFPPLKVTSSYLRANHATINGNLSSQYLSALLLIAPRIAGGLEITVTGQQISKPYIDMTTDCMQQFGVRVINNDYHQYKVLDGQKYQAKDYTVEADFSSAAYFFAIAALTKSTITVLGINSESKQADVRLLDILKSMGSHIERADDRITVRGDELKPVIINMSDCPDQAMTVAVLAAFANGTSTITGIASLRVKETERIKALENELAKMSITTDSTEDSLTIHGGSPKPATIDTYGDHRMAMAFAVTGTKLSDMVINDPDVVNKTFPEFWQKLADISSPKSNVVIIGMRGTGKTTIGKLLSEKLGKKFVDIDAFIEERQGQKIRDIVLKNGWDHYRQLETAACQELANSQNSIVSSGGGMILDPKNINYLQPNARFVLLEGDPKILAKRIEHDKNRVELTSQPTVHEELKEVWEDRKAKYYAAADIVINTDSDDIQQIADEIAEKL